MVPFSVSKDVNGRGGVSGEPRRLFGFLRSDALMLSANVGGEQRRIAAWTRDSRVRRIQGNCRGKSNFSLLVELKMCQLFDMYH